jgi:hypothetical protein
MFDDELRRFGERLKKSIEEQVVRRPLTARLRPALRPVWVSLAALILLGAAAVWLIRPRPHTNRGGPAAAAFLRGLPGLQAIESAPSLPAGGSLLPASPLERNISSVLSVSRAKADAMRPGRSRGFSAIDPESEPLGIQRIYEILVIERSVERVLSDISAKTKEG